MSILTDYQEAYGTVIAERPVDAGIAGQTAAVETSGLVRVNFASTDPADVVALVAWLTGLLADPV